MSGDATSLLFFTDLSFDQKILSRQTLKFELKSVYGRLSRQFRFVPNVKLMTLFHSFLVATRRQACPILVIDVASVLRCGRTLGSKRTKTNLKQTSQENKKMEAKHSLSKEARHHPRNISQAFLTSKHCLASPWIFSNDTFATGTYFSSLA